MEDAVCYGPNRVSPNFTYWSPNPQCDGIADGAFGLNEIMRVESS